MDTDDIDTCQPSTSKHEKKPAKPSEDISSDDQDDEDAIQPEEGSSKEEDSNGKLIFLHLSLFIKISNDSFSLIPETSDSNAGIEYECPFCDEILTDVKMIQKHECEGKILKQVEDESARRI